MDGWKPGGGFVGNENWDVWADFDGSNTFQTRYIRGDKIDQLLGRIDSSDTVAWYLTDHVGSVRHIVDNSGVVQNTIVYDGFGNITSESNASCRDRYKWTGREWDAEAELQYNRARYYDPTIGRWISKDPIGFAAGDSNLYRYVNNQPMMNTDPSGLEGEVRTIEFYYEKNNALITGNFWSRSVTEAEVRRILINARDQAFPMQAQQRERLIRVQFIGVTKAQLKQIQKTAGWFPKQPDGPTWGDRAAQIAEWLAYAGAGTTTGIVGTSSFVGPPGAIPGAIGGFAIGTVGYFIWGNSLPNPRRGGRTVRVIIHVTNTQTTLGNVGAGIRKWRSTENFGASADYRLALFDANIRLLFSTNKVRRKGLIPAFVGNQIARQAFRAITKSDKYPTQRGFVDSATERTPFRSGTFVFSRAAADQLIRALKFSP